MSRHNSTQYNILIVCEGSHTEPNYFKGIKEEVIAMNLWTAGVFIEIRPKSPLEEEEEDAVPSPHKKPRMRRQIKAGISPLPTAEIEEAFKAVPTRYVREAQKGLEDGSFDETWAVFDKDYHPRHPEAFQLAATPVNGKFVQIAFSSISFEHWALLHFEKSKTAFVKSECKDANKKALHCGTGIHEDDCHGAKCVSGYMRASGYLADYSKQANIDLYAALKQFTLQAMENASWLRSKVADTPVFAQNPYTDADFLIKRLLKLEKEFVWLGIDDAWESEGIQIELSRLAVNRLRIAVSNSKNIGLVFNKLLVVQRNGEVMQEMLVELGIIEPAHSRSGQIEINDEFIGLSGLELRMDLDGRHILIFELG